MESAGPATAKPRVTRKRGVKTGRKKPTRSLARAAMDSADSKSEKISKAMQRPVDWSLVDQMLEHIRIGMPMTTCHHGLVSDQLMNRWIMECPELALALKKANNEQDRMFTAKLMEAPAGLWQKWAWLKERLHPNAYSLQHRINIDANHRIDVNTNTCKQLADSWNKFHENNVIEAEIVSDKDGD